MVPVQTNPDGTINFLRGPSRPDLDPWRQKTGAPSYPGYLVDPNRVYRWERDANGKLRRSDLETNKCLGGSR